MVITQLLIQSVVIPELDGTNVEVKLVTVEIVSIPVVALYGYIAVVVYWLNIADIADKLPVMVIDLLPTGLSVTSPIGV